MPGLLECLLANSIEREGLKILKLCDVIDWESLRGYLRGIHKNDIDSKGGQKAYDHVKMLKALILGQWHSLSDEELERSLKLRVDFILFTGFRVGETPDATTLCRFRNKLIEKKKYKTILKKINQELKANNLQVEIAEAAIVDATIIESQAHPEQVLEITEDRNEDDDDNDTDSGLSVSSSKDPDAKWLKKGKKSFYGYKAFAVSDNEGYILETSVKPANVGECKELKNLISELKADRILADKAYASKANREMLLMKGFKDGILHKAQKNKPLKDSQKKFNKLISKTRFVIEQCFGTLKRRFKYTKASYFTCVKVEAQFTFKAICMNINKALNKIIG